MKKQFLTPILFVLAIAIIVLAVVFFSGSSKPGELDEFATCINQSGSTFYGAFWCPHCNDQKKMFGRSSKLLPYTECSAADRKTQLKICTDAGVEVYPTWEFPDGSRQTGALPLKLIAEKTGCSLPSEL